MVYKYLLLKIYRLASTCCNMRSTPSEIFRKEKMLILIMSQLFENGPTFLHEISDLISVTTYSSRASGYSPTYGEQA
jgi:hypothetical protein